MFNGVSMDLYGNQGCVLQKKHEQINKCLLIINWLTYAYPHIHVQIKALGPPT